jgi:hypothetical protein
MPRHIAWSATVLVATTAVVIALDWPHSLAQSPVVQPAPDKSALDHPTGTGSLQGDPPRYEPKTKSSPHDSPEAIYAEFVAASNEKKYSRAVACLPPEHQAAVAMTVVAAALQLEFEPQFSEPLRQTLAAHGIDLKSLPILSFGPERSPASFAETEANWKKEVAPRIRNVPALVADIELIFQKAAEREVPVPTWALQSATYGEQKLGFLRNLKVERQTATAAVRVQRRQAYMPNHYPTMPPQLDTAWVTITFQSIDGKWYLAKFDEFVDESANQHSPPNGVVMPPALPAPIQVGPTGT